MAQVVAEGWERLYDDSDKDEYDFLLWDGPWECMQNIPLGVHLPFEWSGTGVNLCLRVCESDIAI